MNASRVVVSKETMDEAQKPISNGHKFELKCKRVKEHVESKPSGYEFTTKELASAAGYDISDERELAAGKSFVNGFFKREDVSAEKVPGTWKYWIVFKDKVVTHKLNNDEFGDDEKESADVRHNNKLIQFSRETALKLDNKALDYSKRRAVRLNRIREYVYSYRVGTTFSKLELGIAAGYTIDQAPGAKGFIKSLEGNGFIRFHGGYKAKRWLVTFPGDDKATEQKVAPVEPVSSEPTEVVQETTPQPPADEQPVPHYNLDAEDGLDVDFIQRVHKLAKDYAWRHNDDSLRGFVRSLL